MESVSFDTFVGNESAVALARAWVTSAKRPQAVVVDGPTFVGAKTLARCMAASFLGIDSARLQVHPDVVSVRVMANEKTGRMREKISTEQIQAALERLAQSALSGRKVLLIYGADQLSASAANALLKTLEEPRDDTWILCTAVQWSSVLPTIRSRGARLRLALVRDEQVEAVLQKAGATPEAAHQWAEWSAGRPGRAFRLLRDPDERARVADDVARATACTHARPAARILSARDLLPPPDPDHVKTRGQLSERLSILEQVLHDQMLAASGAVPAGPVATRSAPELARALHALAQLRQDLARHLHPRLALIRAFQTS